MLGFAPDNVMRDYMQHAKAFVFAAEEDFGITPVEAQACGTPVIAYGKGGSLETVRGLGVQEKPTGVFFEKQTVESLKSAVTRFEYERSAISCRNCRYNAERFGEAIFRQTFKKYVDRILVEKNEKELS